ncbi:MAG: hypothetical protein ACUVUG_10185 [Candidatus Aminicenantia bacterium]
MNSFKNTSFLTCVILMSSIVFLSSFANGDGKFSGHMFGDFFYNISNNNSYLKHQNGFWFRRIYFTYDYKISEKWSTRLRFEITSPGDFQTSDSMKPYVKDAYLAYTKESHNVFIGLSPTPTWEYIEGFWGYRAVEKPPLDLYKMGDSRDFGIAFKGSFGKKKFFGYHFFVGNGEGVKSEFNKDKKYMGAFLFNPTKNLSLEFYADYAQGANNKSYYTYQGFLGWKRGSARIGIQYSQQTKKQGPGKEDLKMDVYSIFGVLEVGEKISILARSDRVADPLPWGSKISYVPFNNTAPFYLILLGVDFHLFSNVRFIPNIMYVSYDKVNEKSIDKDLQLKLTFFYTL